MVRKHRGRIGTWAFLHLGAFQGFQFLKLQIPWSSFLRGANETEFVLSRSIARNGSYCQHTKSLENGLTFFWGLAHQKPERQSHSTMALPRTDSLATT